MTLRPIAGEYRTCEDTSDLRLDDTAELYAGGTDLIPLIRAGLVETEVLVDIKRSELSTTVEAVDGGWRIGALATLADLEDHAGLADSHPAIIQAVRQSATRQIRHRATVAGNLLQRPRCSYFRDAEIDCWMKGGDSCPAKLGRNEHHGLRGEECVAVQPSDLASVLTALGATVSVASPDHETSTERSIDDVLVTPTSNNRRLHALGHQEVIHSIHLPAAAGRSVYLKAMDRAVWQFALVGLAAVVDFGSGGEVTSARLVASGVSNTPLLLEGAEASLMGRTLDSEAIAAAADGALDGLEPLSENAYKLQMLAGLVQRALEQLADSRGGESAV